MVFFFTFSHFLALFPKTVPTYGTTIPTSKYQSGLVPIPLINMRRWSLMSTHSRVVDPNSTPMALGVPFLPLIYMLEGRHRVTGDECVFFGCQQKRFLLSFYIFELFYFFFPCDSTLLIISTACQQMPFHNPVSMDDANFHNGPC